MSFLKKLSRAFVASDKDGARGKEGCRAYAIGDIHGRLDLLNLLIERVEQDIAERPQARNFIIFLGDYIDRGPESAGVIERLRTYRPANATPVFLSGNRDHAGKTFRAAGEHLRIARRKAVLIFFKNNFVALDDKHRQTAKAF